MYFPQIIRLTLSVFLVLAAGFCLAAVQVEIEIKTQKKFDLQIFYLDEVATKWKESASVHRTIYPSKQYQKYSIKIPNATEIHNIRFDLGAKPNNRISISAIAMVEGEFIQKWKPADIFTDFYSSRFLTITGLNDSSITFETIDMEARFDPYIHLLPENNRLINEDSISTSIRIVFRSTKNSRVTVGPSDYKIKLSPISKSYKSKGIDSIEVKFYGIKQLRNLYISISSNDTATLEIFSVQYQDQSIRRVFESESLTKYFSFNSRNVEHLQSNLRVVSNLNTSLSFWSSQEIKTRKRELIELTLLIIGFIISAIFLFIVNDRLLGNKPVNAHFHSPLIMLNRIVIKK